MVCRILPSLKLLAINVQPSADKAVIDQDEDKEGQPLNTHNLRYW